MIVVGLGSLVGGKSVKPQFKTLNLVRFPSMAEKNVTEKIKYCCCISAKKLCLTTTKKGYINFCAQMDLKAMQDVTLINLTLEQAKWPLEQMKYFKRPPFQLGIETDFDLNLDGHLLKHHFFQSKKENRSFCRFFFFPQQSVGMKSSSALRTTNQYAAALEVAKPKQGWSL